MKKLLITLLFAAGLLTAVAAAENAGRAVLGISPHEKDIIVTAVTADGSPVQVEGCTVTELPSGERTVLTATGTKVILKGAITKLDCSANQLISLDVRNLAALQELDCRDNKLTSLDVQGLNALQELNCS
ncbi:MAG: leucine-rich repeat domain-containing protein, partial [Treponema sp.]